MDKGVGSRSDCMNGVMKGHALKDRIFTPIALESESMAGPLPLWTLPD
jgi:hypothetical protein